MDRLYQFQCRIVSFSNTGSSAWPTQRCHSVNSGACSRGFGQSHVEGDSAGAMLVELLDGLAFGRRANAVARARSRRAEGLVHNPPDRTGTADTFGAASQTPIDRTGRPHGAFGRNGSDLMVRDDVARTHDHEGTPGSIGHSGVFSFMHLSASASHPDENVSLPLCDDARQAL